MALIFRPKLQPTDDEKAALAGTGTPGAADPYVNDSDSRLSDARTPTAHKASHVAGAADELSAQEIGGKQLHGIELCGAISFDNSTHILKIADEVGYWYQGAMFFAYLEDTECDLDSHVTLTENTLYYVYFANANGTLYASADPWTLTDHVPVATVFWNGTSGAVCRETHNHNRDLKWHAWAHSTVGARISASDFAMTAPSSGSPSTVDFAGGTLWDEDIANTFTRNTPAGMLLNCRIWYQTGANTWTFVDSNSIYPAGGVSFVDSGAAYALRAITTGQANAWIYASPDIDRPLYVFLETINRNGTGGYANAAAARAITPPSLVGAPVQQELKLLYRVIMSSAEAFTEATDYRSSASLPAGGTTAPSASAVSFVPSGGVAATSVQTAIEELDTEKEAAGTCLPLAGGTMTGDITQGENTALVLDPALSADGKYCGIVRSGTAGAALAFGDLVTLDKDDSRWELVDISAAAAATGDARGLLGICVQAANADGDATKVLLWGVVRADANFPALTIGAPVYASTTGDIVVAQPTTTDHVIRVIGYGLTADELAFQPTGSWITHT